MKKNEVARQLTFDGFPGAEIAENVDRQNMLSSSRHALYMDHLLDDVCVGDYLTEFNVPDSNNFEES